jgi:DNA-binding CsgD family transcriptional regulator
MTTHRTALLARSRRAIVGRAHAGLDPWTLRRETLSLLRRVMGIDAIWWALTDPDTLLFSQALTDEVPTRAAPLFLENELLHDDVNKFALLARGPDPVGTLYGATHGRPERSRRFCEILRPNRMGDELRVALRDRRHTWGAMCLHRGAGTRPFSSEERMFLRQLGPHLAAGLRQSLLLRHGAAVEPALPGVLIVTSALDPVSITVTAKACLSELDDWPRSGVRSLAVVSVVARLLATEQAVATLPDQLPRLRVQTRTGAWVTLSASRLPSTAGADHIAVVVEPERSDQMIPLLFAAFGLTASEERIAHYVLQGARNREIARTLGITPLTVQQHLKGVFEKAGVHSRGELRARLQMRRLHVEP